MILKLTDSDNDSEANRRTDRQTDRQDHLLNQANALTKKSRENESKVQSLLDLSLAQLSPILLGMFTYLNATCTWKQYRHEKDKVCA